MNRISFGKAIKQGSLGVYNISNYKNGKIPKKDKYIDICLNCDVPADKCIGSCSKINYGRY